MGENYFMYLHLFPALCVCVCGRGGEGGGRSDHEVDSVTNIVFITVTINIGENFEVVY